MEISRHNSLKFLGGAALLLVLGVTFLSWKSWVETKLTAIFEAKGFRNVHLTVDTLGFNGIVLKDVSLGGNTPLTLENVTVGYSLQDLWQGNINTLIIKGLSFSALKEQEKWIMSGLENDPNNSGKVAATLPVTQEELAVIPLSSLQFENSKLRIATNAWQMEMPLQLTLQKLPSAKISYKAQPVVLKSQAAEIAAGEMSVDAALNEPQKKWEGQWQIKDIAVKSETAAVPLMQGKGTITATAERFLLDGGVLSADKSYKADFTVDYFLNAPEKSIFTLESATVPWNSGILSVANVKVPLSGDHTIDANIKVQRVSIDALVQMLTGNRATATGLVSGTIPVTIGTDGSITFHEGSLHAEQPGTIVMAPDAIPGDNEKIAIVREILKNLHYSNLSIAVNSGKDNKLSVLLVLEGNNPDVYDGRPVKLNVNLSGDMLNLMKQSVMPFLNPEQLLK